ncbi:hypothetical protein AVEN_259743-1 [Araneus ventricosus]|uniref:HTH CENPB-type domain-containing protein n=1 Tax=Araneus ventricosus TaxID=182803 RepID=A0A4Y2D4M5_ARAVE|nr:hypothetical protein AVEN_259743-1 [Araneus ventricosus]
MMQQKGLKFNSELGGSKEFQASSGWLEKFKNRQLNSVGDKLSSDIEAGNSFIAELQDLIVKEKSTATIYTTVTKLGYIREHFQRKPWLQKMKLLLHAGKR